MQGSHVVEMFPSSAAHYPIAKFPRHFATVLLLIDDLLDVIKSLWWLVFSQNACDLERKNKNSCELHQKKTNINDAKTRPKEVEKQTDPGLVCAGRASISCSLSISEKPLAPKIVRSSLAFDTYIVYPPVHEGVPHHLAPTWSCRLLWHVSSWALLAPLELALQVQILIQSNLTRPQPIFPALMVRGRHPPGGEIWPRLQQHQIIVKYHQTKGWKSEQIIIQSSSNSITQVKNVCKFFNSSCTLNSWPTLLSRKL